MAGAYDNRSGGTVAGGGGPGAGAGYRTTDVTLTQAQIRDLHNTRVLLVPAVAGHSIMVHHFIFERAAGVAATAPRNDGTPRIAVVLSDAAGGQIASQGAEGVFARAVYRELVSGVITGVAYRFRIGVGNHALVADTPLVLAMNAGVVTGNPTGSFRVITYYEALE